MLEISRFFQQKVKKSPNYPQVGVGENLLGVPTFLFGFIDSNFVLHYALNLKYKKGLVVILSCSGVAYQTTCPGSNEDRYSSCLKSKVIPQQVYGCSKKLNCEKKTTLCTKVQHSPTSIKTCSVVIHWSVIDPFRYSSQPALKHNKALQNNIHILIYRLSCQIRNLFICFLNNIGQLS